MEISDGEGDTAGGDAAAGEVELEPGDVDGDGEPVPVGEDEGEPVGDDEGDPVGNGEVEPVLVVGLGDGCTLDDGLGFGDFRTVTGLLLPGRPGRIEVIECEREGAGGPDDPATCEGIPGVTPPIGPMPL
jgi:hypothetical protein